MPEKIINGTMASAKIFTTNNEVTAIDSYAITQLQNLCDNEASCESKIRVMPDVHPGKVCTIGLTMTVGSRVIPEIVGIDIGCGMTVARVKKFRKEFQKLDAVIRERVPSGFEQRKTPHHMADEFDYSKMCCAHHVRKEIAEHALGTLGGGNHFIEIDIDDEGNAYVVVHSGSRHLGVQVTEHYLRLGQQELKSRGESVPYELTYLEGERMQQYLHDVQCATQFASLNRHIIINEICKAMKWKIDDEWECVHNYVDMRGFDSTNDSGIDSTVRNIDNTKSGAAILRKGAISARAGERVVIPINMRDGIILGTGLGNAEWNFSAPHGSGRILKRSEVKNAYTVSNFKSEMKGIYTSCVNKGTLDEAPFAYRAIDEILEVIEPTVAVEKIIKPLYNFKAGREE